MKECIYITKTCYSHDNQLPGKLSTNERGNNFLEKKKPCIFWIFFTARKHDFAYCKGSEMSTSIIKIILKSVKIYDSL